ncbi:hypothetical protein GCM10009677_31830 [Sphaerisporangium rubeum]|uniref:Probable endolytic peptidoglycan transglycosylase RlpA n=1 Tax=Sphaerisporangium rubeum TaxID=321317 RepID=A0A7X0IDH8_9ACTN|nr:septal ring lytic transglycosylase RlpA family protein [Sphaerisporangium rubeum]MBB6472479.1 rare lipoprotein A [Sphaerisporangium rubeum]
MGSQDPTLTANTRSRRRLTLTVAAALAVATAAAGGTWLLTGGTPAKLTATATIATRPPDTPPPGAPSATSPASAPTPAPSPTETAAPGSPEPATDQALPPQTPAPKQPQKTPAPKKTPKKKAPVKSKVLASGSCGASFYDEGQMTASGERFNPNAMTAAHKTLPMGSIVRVINPGNGASVKVRINDRGPFIAGRCLDLSRAAFDAIGSLSAGTMTVRYQVLAR